MDCGQLDKAPVHPFIQSCQFFDKKLQVWFRTWTLGLREQEYRLALVAASINAKERKESDDQQKDWEQNSSALAKRLESVKQKAGSVIKAVI